MSDSNEIVGQKLEIMNTNKIEPGTAQQAESRVVDKKKNSAGSKKAQKQPQKKIELDLSVSSFPALQKSQISAEAPSAVWPIAPSKPKDSSKAPKETAAPVVPKPPTQNGSKAPKAPKETAPPKLTLTNPRNAHEALELQYKLRSELGTVGEQIDATQTKVNALFNTEEEKALKESLAPISKEIEANRQKLKDLGATITAKEGSQGTIRDVVEELKLTQLQVGPLLDDNKLLAAQKRDAERAVRDLESQLKTINIPSVSLADLEKALKEAVGILKQKDLHPDEVKKQNSRKGRLLQAISAHNDAGALQLKLKAEQDTLEKIDATMGANKAQLQRLSDSEKALQEKLQTLRDSSKGDALAALYKERDDLRAQLKKLTDSKTQKQEDFNSRHRPLITERAAAKLRLEALLAQKKDILAALKHYDQFVHRIVVTIETELIPAVIGKAGANIAELREKVKADVVVETDGRITLRGDKPEVENAKRLLDELVRQHRRIVLDIPIDSVMVGVLIGKGGSNIVQIQKDTGAEVDVSDTNVRVRGTEDTVKAAKSIIETFLRENKLVLVEVPLTEDVVPAVIGTKGATINKIREESGARIEVSKETFVVTITGKEEMVEKAKIAIETIAAENKKSRIEMKIAQDMIPVLIGTKGATINRIRKESGGARIEVAKDSNHVVIEGKEDRVHKAKDLIDELIRQTNEESIDIRFAKEHLETILGKAGNNVRQLRTQSGADIQIDTIDLVLTIRGTKERVRKASEMLESLMRSSAETPMGTLSFDAERIGVLIGKEGSTIQRIQRESGADSIRVDRETGVVSVFGTRAAFDKAKALVAELAATLPATSPKSSSLEISFLLESDRFLGAVFGKGGEKLRSLQQELGVVVDVDKSAKPVIVSIRGKTEESVNAAKASILQTVQQEEKTRRAPRRGPSTSERTTPAAASGGPSRPLRPVLEPVDTVKAPSS